MTSLAASTFVWFFILIPLLIVWVLGVADILRRPISGTAKAAWILLVVLLPFAGTLLYFILRKPTPEEIRLAADASGEPARGWSTRPPPPVE